MIKQSPPVTTILQEFLGRFAPEDLAGLYNPSMDVTVLVAPDNGERDGKAWTDGIQTWFPFAVRNIDTANMQLKYDFTSHVEAVGLSGWDWENQITKWVAFDFDSIVNHKAGITADELKEIEESFADIDWVEIRKSTSGKGLHLYVYLDPVIPTANRKEHSAVARAVLHKMSAITGLHLKDKVDICGGNMWFWHRKLLRCRDGLTRIKESTPLGHLPDWESHLSMICTGKAPARAYDDITNSRAHTQLSKTHRQVIQWLQDNNRVWWWDADKNMLVCHTNDLKEMHTSLNLVGLFETDSSGTTTQNCFCFPLRSGGWIVRRFTPGCTEHKIWHQDRSGWTTSYFNCPTTIEAACRAFGGTEHPSGYYMFDTFKALACSAEALDSNVDYDESVSLLPAKLKEHKDGRLIVEVIDKESIGVSYFKDSSWVRESKSWKKIFPRKKTSSITEEAFQYDDTVRHLVSPTGEDQGWAVNSCGDWNCECLTHIRLALQAMDVPSKEIAIILGSSVLKPWKIVNIPFASEYPGDRRWNRNAAQLKYQPIHEIPPTLIEAAPNWHKLLSHLGSSLDSIISVNDWAQNHSIYTGVDYLCCWIASLFQEPTKPLPYLFLYSEEQNTGKSMFHEALSLLMTNGVVRADQSLISDGGFNGELESGVLCVVEETDITQSRSANNRIKDWVTAREIMIHRKNHTPYLAQNISHWIQTSNEPKACPVFDGDTRIVVIHISPLKKIIPKSTFIKLLESEAENFITYIMNFNVPDSNDRLNVPVITTIEKMMLQQSNKNVIETFIEDELKPAPGYLTRFSDFYDRYISYCQKIGEDDIISKSSAIKLIPAKYPTGNGTANVKYIGNVVFNDEPVEDTGSVYILNGKALRKITR